MPIMTLGRDLNLCFTKMKRPPEDRNRPLPTPATRSLLITNFNSLYDQPTSLAKSSSSSSSASESDTTETATPDFATVFASQRFFFSSPGLSNSIIESSSLISSLSSSSSNSPPGKAHTVVGGGIPIPTFSPDPYMDFRRSMQEMVAARDLIIDVRANWDYLHELLTCYLDLNPKSTHKFIIRAFADLLITLMPSPSTPEDSDFTEAVPLVR